MMDINIRSTGEEKWEGARIQHTFYECMYTQREIRRHIFQIQTRGTIRVSSYQNDVHIRC